MRWPLLLLRPFVCNPKGGVFFARFIPIFPVNPFAMLKNAEPENKNDEAALPAAKPALFDKGEVSEFAKTALVAVVIALIIRSVFLEPFNIPSGSMKPTLEVGDYLFVNKPAYGYSRFSFPFGIAPIEGRLWAKPPQRGDIIVFALPKQTRIDYIKRIIGLPGDRIQVQKGRLYINGAMIAREFIGIKKVSEKDGAREIVMNEYIQTLPEGTVFNIYEESDQGPLDDTPEYTVPEGHYFVMGDNRDYSQDSRVSQMVGPVPFENIVGRADFLFFSSNGYARIFEIWKWPWSIRYDRLFMDIDPVRPPSEVVPSAAPSQVQD
jgi:signal peptidase I